MKTEILKRTFEAKKHPIGSQERNNLNCNSLTSEYMTSYKYETLIHKEETETHLAHSLKQSHRTKKEAEDYLKSKIN